MFLNEQLCAKCVKDWTERQPVSQAVGIVMFHFVQFWKAGKVKCPHLRDAPMAAVMVTAENVLCRIPPKDCPYSCEHVMLCKESVPCR